MSVFVVFQFPISLVVLVMQIVFLFAKPIANVENKQIIRHLFDVAVSFFWVICTCTILMVFYFGTILNAKPAELGDKFNEMLLQTMLDY